MNLSKIEHDQYVERLDNPEYINAIDRYKMFTLLNNFSSQLKEGMRNKIDLSFSNVNNVVIGGMGGSSIGGYIFKSILEDLSPFPIEVVNRYTLPGYVSEKSVVIIASYSGNTEETISMLREAIKKTKKRICITSGGAIKDICEEASIPYITIKPGYPPRAAMGYMLIPLLKIAETAKLIDAGPVVSESIDVIEEMNNNLSVGVPVEHNIAKQIAIKLMWKYISVYGSTTRMYPAALRFKTEINENSKMHVNLNYFPEMNHNDVEGWEGGYFMNRVAIIFRDKNESDELRKRIEVTKSMVMDPDNLIELYPKGNSVLANILSQIYAGDYISLYLAILYGVDPGEVKIIQKIKSLLTSKS